MNIKPIGLTHLPLSALFQFTSDLIELIEKNGADKLKIEAQFNLLIEAFKKFDAAYKKERKNNKTDKIAALDKLRDGLINAILAIVKGMLNSMDADVREAAKKLKQYFSGYKGVTKKSFRAQSGDTTNLIQGLTGKYAAEVELLGLGRLVKELGDANTEVISNINVRVNEWAEQNKADMGLSKKKVVIAIRTIFKLLDVYVTTEGDVKYTDFINQLNVMIAGYSGGRSASAGDEK